MTPSATEAVTIGTATTIAVSYLFQAALSVALGWAGWQFRQARRATERLTTRVEEATQQIAIFNQWREDHQEQHKDLRERLAELSHVVTQLPRTTMRGNGL